MLSKLVLFIFTFMIFDIALAITEPVRQLIQFETKANAVTIRSSEAIALPHIEIPLNVVGLDFAETLDENIKSVLIFKKNGVPYVRWILNPEDTEWHKDIEWYVEYSGAKAEKKYYFTGYQTASRSYIVENPEKTVQFSVKSSTNKTGGLWTDKKQSLGEALDARMNAEFLKSIQKVLPFKNIIILDEPAAMTIRTMDQAVLIRSLDHLDKNHQGHIYLPGFSALHEKVGAEIAKLNGVSDPMSFWTKHYIEAAGRALGELAARTGMQFDSPHSQNFLIELDRQYKPTGKIVFRDLADFFMYDNMLGVLHPNYAGYTSRYSQQKNIVNYIKAGFGPLHGNAFPSWVSEKDYDNWMKVFFTTFESEFKNISGLDLQSSQKSIKYLRNGKFFKFDYQISNSNLQEKEFWRNLIRSRTPNGKNSCSVLFAY